MKVFIFLLIILQSIFYSYGLTELVSTFNCFAIANSPFTVVGARIFSEREKGYKVCYYAPKSNEHYFFIKVNNLNLAQIGSVCPKFKIEIYTSTRQEQHQDFDIQISFEVPESPRLLFEADCNNYKEKINQLYKTFAPNDKIILTYDPSTETAPDNAYDITLSSYRIGRSYSCPEKTYLCWSSDHVCIDESLLCDSSDNCYDNSDENNYQCTGRIGDLPVPLFIICIIGAIIFFIFAIMVCILLMRNKRNKKHRALGQMKDMTTGYYGDDSILRPSSYAT